MQIVRTYTPDLESQIEALFIVLRARPVGRRGIRNPADCPSETEPIPLGACLGKKPASPCLEEPEHAEVTGRRSEQGGAGRARQ